MVNANLLISNTIKITGVVDILLFHHVGKLKILAVVIGYKGRTCPGTLMTSKINMLLAYRPT